MLWPLLVFWSSALRVLLFTADNIRIRIILLWSRIHQWSVHSRSPTLTTFLIQILGISFSLFLSSHGMAIVSWRLSCRILFLFISDLDWRALITYHIWGVICSLQESLFVQTCLGGLDHFILLAWSIGALVFQWDILFLLFVIWFNFIGLPGWRIGADNSYSISGFLYLLSKSHTIIQASFRFAFRVGLSFGGR